MFLNNYKCKICKKTFDIEFPEGEGTGEIACPECGKKYRVIISDDQFLIAPKKVISINNNKNNENIVNEVKNKKSYFFKILKFLIIIVVCLSIFYDLIFNFENFFIFIGKIFAAIVLIVVINFAFKILDEE